MRIIKEIKDITACDRYRVLQIPMQQSTSAKIVPKTQRRYTRYYNPVSRRLKRDYILAICDCEYSTFFRNCITWLTAK